MRHRKKTVKLGRMSSHRKAMLSNMAGSVILHGKIYTTLPKAKAAAPVVEKLVSWAKRGTLHGRRLSFRILKDRSLVKKLFSEVAPAAADRNGGYTRIIKAGTRHGDGALMSVLEIVDMAPALAEGEITKPSDKKKKKKL